MQKKLNGSVDNTQAEKKRARVGSEVLKRIEALQKKHDEIGLELRELAELVVDGQTGTKPFYRKFVRSWEAMTGEKYVGNVARDLGSVRRLRRKLADDELEERAVRFFQEHDTYKERRGYSLGCFEDLMNQIGYAGSKASRNGGGSDDLLSAAGF